MTGDNFETDEQPFEDAVKPQFEEASRCLMCHSTGLEQREE